MRILLVEDDFSLGETIFKWLDLDGYAVDWVRDGKSAQTALLSQSYDCVLLDRGLPGVCGDDVLHQLRQESVYLPVIMITALDSVMNRVQGLDLGADDYLVKPFDLEELSARIRAAIRRSQGCARVVLKHQDVELDPAGKTVTQNGVLVSLTAKEYTILYALMQHPGQVIARSQLEDKLYAWGNEIESNAIEVHIHHLRKKLGGDFIRTLRGLGYALTCKDDAAKGGS